MSIAVLSIARRRHLRSSDRGRDVIETESDVVPGPGAGVKAAPGRSPLELFAAAIALLIPIVWAAGFEAESFTGRSAILLLVIGVGFPILLLQAWTRRDIAARAAVVFVLIGVASAALSHNRTVAIFGLYNQGTGLLFMASLTAAWAVGRSIRPATRPLVERALLLGVGVNIGVSLLGAFVDLSSVSPQLVDPTGRQAGLAGNPVHLAALAVLGMALIVPRFASAPARWAVPTAAAAAAVQLSGTRSALIVIVGIVLWAGRRHGVRVGAMLGALCLVGLLAASAPGASGSTTATSRGAGSSLRARPETWLSTRHSIAKHPFLGVGPGQFRDAAAPYRPIAVGQAEGPDRLFTDAHNIFVQYAATTGLLGLAALVIWLLAATRQARGCLLAGALAVLFIGLFEPQSVATTPLAFLALGAAGGFEALRLRRPRGYAYWMMRAGCIAGAIGIAAVFLVGEFDLRQGTLDYRSAPAAQANRILPAWPRAPQLLGEIAFFHAIVDKSQPEYEMRRTWLVVALHRDDTDPTLWNDLAQFDELRGRNDDAVREYSAAVRLNPTSVIAMNGLSRMARRRCDLVQEGYWRERSLRLAAPSPLSGGANPKPPAACRA